MEVASLGLSVKVDGVEQANKSLDRLVEKSGSATKSVSDLGAAADSASGKAKSLDSATSSAASSSDGLAKSAAGAAKSAGEMGGAADAASKASSDLGKSASAAATSADSLSKSTKSAGDAASGLSKGSSAASAAVSDLGKGAQQAATSADSLAAGVKKTGANVSEFSSSSDSAKGSVHSFAQSLGAAETRATAMAVAASVSSKKSRDMGYSVEVAVDATRELDKGASGAANSTKALDTSAGSAAKSTGALDKGASSAAKSAEALDKGAGKADKSTKGMGDSAGKATAKVDEMGKKAASTERGVSSFASAALKAGAVLAAAFSVSSIARYADAWSDMQSKVGAATKDMEGAAGMMTRLVDIANASYSPLEQTAAVFARNVATFRDLGRNAEQAAKFTEAVNSALVTTATRGQDADVVVGSLSRSLAIGKLDADAFDTIVSRSPRTLQAMADQLKVSTSALRGMATQGKVTSDVIVDGMISSLDQLREEAAKMPATITDAFVILTNNVTEFVGKIDKATGASAAISGVIIDFAGWLRKAGDYALAFGAVLAPAFKAVGSVISVVAENATVFGVALAGFAAPAVIGGIASLTTAIGVGLLGALKAVTALMLANPIGLMVAAFAAAGYAAYKFRDEIKQSVGVDVVEVAKGTANTLIGSFAAAYEDIKFVWNGFGDLMGGAVIGGVNLAIRAINSLIQGSISGVNSLVEAINNIPGVDIGKIGSSVGINELANPYADRNAVSVAQRNAAVQAAMSRDYVGDIGGWLDGIGKGGATAAGDSGSVGGGKGGAGAGGKSGATVAIEAETDAIKRALKDQVSALEEAMERNEYLYGLGIRQASEYYETKATLGRDSGLAEAAAAEQEIGVINKALAANKLTEDQRKKLLEDRRKLVGDVAAATIKAFSAEVAAEEAAARKRIAAQQDMTKSAQSAAGAAADQANALALQVEQYDMTATAIANANVARADEDLAIAQTTRAMAIMRGERTEDIALIDQEIEAIKSRALALRSVAGSTAKLEVLNSNKDFADEAKKQNEQIGDSLTDALLRGFEDGAGFAENFKTTMVNLFKTMVLKPIIQPIAQGSAGYVTNALGLGGTGTAASAGSSMLGTAGNALSLGSSLMGGSGSIWSAIGGSSLLGATNVGMGLQVAGSSGILGGLSSAGSLAGIGEFGMAFGAALPAIGAAVTGVTLLTSLLGNKSKPGVGNYGLADITSTGSVAASNDSLFFGDRRGFQGQSAGLNTGLTGLGDQIAAAAKLYGGDASGLRLYAQTAYSPDGKGSSGGTAIYGRDGQQVFGSSFSGTNEQMGEMLSLTIQRSLLGGLKESNLAPQFANVLNNAVDIGTATAEQLTQISAALESVRNLHAAFDAMSSTFPTLTALGWESREALVAAAGGLDAFTGNLNTYYGAFYSEAERTANSLSQMKKAAAQLGVALPDTREGFRALVESQDLTTAAGQRTYASLIAMSGQFDEWATSAKNAADAVIAEDKRISDQRIADAKKDADLLASILSAARDAAETQANGALSALTRSVNTEKERLATAWQDQQAVMKEGIDAATTALNNHRALSERVKSTLNSLFAQTDAAMQRSTAQGQISAALATARAGGGLPEAGVLDNAFGIIAQPSQQLFKTFSDYQLDFLKTANDIAALGQLTDVQISVEERTLTVLKQQLTDAEKAYKAQVDYYDQILTNAQAQLDAALGNTQATLTVAQAMTAFTSSLAGVIASQANKPPSTNGAPAGLSGGQQVVWDAYQGSGIGNLDAGGWNFWNEAIKNGADPTAIAAEIAAINAGKAAINGSHAMGLDRVPFDGYVAELHAGERVKTKAEARAEDMARVQQANGGGMMADAESLRILQQLLIRVGDMNAETKAIAQNTGQWIRLANRWDGDGLPPTRDELT